MRQASRHGRLARLVDDPSTLLAYCSMRLVLTPPGKSVGSSHQGFIILIVPTGFRPSAYKEAAYFILDQAIEEWGEPRAKVRLACPPERVGSTERQISIFDLCGLRILIAASLDEVPKEVMFVANSIVQLEPPSARIISDARRLLRMPPLSEENVLSLVGKTENIILAGLLRADWLSEDIAALDNPCRWEVPAPDLFELPGFEELKVWAQGLLTDVAKWRDRELSWDEVSRGALLAGPPGAGKTFFTGALAKLLGFKLVCTTVGAWLASGNLNDALGAMRKSFNDAKTSRGAVLLIDELDSIGVRPDRPSGHPNEVFWQVLVNEFLSLINNPGEGVVVMGATNFPDRIDRAILRAGRIENYFELLPPDASTRAAILRYHAEGVLARESLMELAEELDGISAATLEKLVRNARKRARDEGRELELRDLQAELPEKLKYTSEQKFRLGVHEAGHALISLALGYASSAIIELKDGFDPEDPSRLGGITSYELIEDHLPTESSLLNRIAIALAGMAAEEAVFGDRSLGSGGMFGSDVERATTIARRMVASYGLGKTPVFIGQADQLGGLVLPASFEDEAIAILKTEYDRVSAMLAGQKGRVIALARDAATHRKVKIERNSRNAA